jgi:sugar lactone lactonase YvrE
VAFGGPALDILYITTARHLMKPEEIATKPLSGALFAASPGVHGLANAKFEG